MISVGFGIVSSSVEFGHYSRLQVYVGSLWGWSIVVSFSIALMSAGPPVAALKSFEHSC